MNQTTPSQRLPKIAILLVILIDSAGIGLVYPILTPLFINPEYGFFNSNLSVGQREILLGITLAIYPLFMFIGSLFLGQYSDRAGRKLALSICMIGAAGGYIISAIGIIQASFLLLVFGRIITGITAGAHAIAQAIFTDISTGHDKIRNMNQLALANSLGFVIGPALGGFFSSDDISSAFAFHTPFLIAAGFAILVLLFLQITFKETFRYTPEKRTSTEAQTAFKRLFGLLKQDDIKKLVIVYFLFSAGYNFYYQFLSVYTMEIYAFDSSQIGLFLAYFSACLTVMLMLFTQPILKRWPLNQAIAFSLATLALFIALAITIPSQLLLWLSIIPITFGTAISYTANITGFSNLSSEKNRGQMMGLANATRSLAWVVAPLISGFLASMHINLPFMVGIVMLGFGAWVVLLVNLNEKIS